MFGLKLTEENRRLVYSKISKIHSWKNKKGQPVITIEVGFSSPKDYVFKCHNVGLLEVVAETLLFSRKPEKAEPLLAYASVSDLGENFSIVEKLLKKNKKAIFVENYIMYQDMKNYKEAFEMTLEDLGVTKEALAKAKAAPEISEETREEFAKKEKELRGDALEAFDKKNPDAKEERKKLKSFLKNLFSLEEVLEDYLEKFGAVISNDEKSAEVMGKLFLKQFVEKLEDSKELEEEGPMGDFLRKGLKEAKKTLKEEKKEKPQANSSETPKEPKPEAKETPRGSFDSESFQEGVTAWFFTKPYFSTLEVEVQVVFKCDLPETLITDMVFTFGLSKTQEICAFDIIKKVKSSTALTAALKATKVWSKFTDAAHALEALGHAYTDAETEVTDVEPKAPSPTAPVSVQRTPSPIV